MTLAALGDAIDYSPTVVQRILSGTYGAGTDKVITSIYRYKSLYEARKETGDRPPYVQTSMAQRIWDAADYARVRQQIVSVIGLTQRGKTTAIREYAATKGATVLVRCPVSPSPGKMIRRMAQALGNTGTGNMDMYMDYLYRTITPQHLIVVDEIHQVILQERKLGIRTVETLREIADECGCGMLLIGTKVWCDALNRDLNWKGVLEQIVKRGMTVALKDVLPVGVITRGVFDSDMVAISTSFHHFCNTIASVQIFPRCLIICIPDADFFHTAFPRSPDACAP